MFFTERMIGMLTYVVVTLVVYWLLLHGKSLKKRKAILFSYLLTISTMAFFYVPYETADVYRLIEYMNTYASMSISDFITTLGESGTPAMLIYYRLIGVVGYPGLLSAITTFIVFLNIFYVIYDYSKNNKIGGKAVAITLLTVMSTGIYMQTVGNIRTMLAFSILARCFYDETVNKKKVYKNIIWYLIACLIHPAAIVAVIIRACVYVWSSMRHRNTRSILFFFATLPVSLYFIVRFGGERFIETISGKADVYINDISYTYLWDNVIAVLTIAVIVISYRMYRFYSKRPGELSKVIEFSWVLSIFASLLFFEHATFVRFTQLNLLIMLPVIIYNISKVLDSKPERLTKILYRFYGIAVILIFVVSASRGALSSLKFFVFS